MSRKNATAHAGNVSGIDKPITEGSATCSHLILPFGPCQALPLRALRDAVQRALSLMAAGKPPALANTIAANEFGLSVTSVARCTGAIAGRSKRRKAVRR